MIRILLIVALILVAAAAADAQIGLPAGISQLYRFASVPPVTSCVVGVKSGTVGSVQTGTTVGIHC